MYVVIEGIDTAGKSTQLEILKNKFPNAIFTKEPGGTTLGTKLREMILSGEANSSLAE
ncbi:MAG TPA: dTMP kinase, partial [Aliarcobacter cryaerophilus]|nr:dTMP kinase [Aliarcobacter cryaerophilus]